MSKDNAKDAARSLTKQLHAELTAAVAKCSRAARNIVAAKTAFISAKADVKKLRKIIGRFADERTSRSVTKKIIRPIVKRLLASQPLSEAGLLTALEVKFKAKGYSLILGVI